MSDAIVIDAGHGGRDRFNVGAYGYVEADATLIMAIACQKRLEHNGIRVIMTRTTDTDLDPGLHWNEARDLQARCDIANEDAGAKYFVSIHTDASSNVLANGTTGYCLELGGAGSILAQSIVNRLLLERHLYNRGVVGKNLHVLRETNMPAVLIEVGFHTNIYDLHNLLDNLFLIQAGESIARGILDLLGINDVYEEVKVKTVQKMPVTILGTTLKGLNVDSKGYMPIRALCEYMGWSFEYKDGGITIDTEKA